MIERPSAIQMFGWLFGKKSGDGTKFNTGNPFSTGQTSTGEPGSKKLLDGWKLRIW